MIECSAVGPGCTEIASVTFDGLAHFCETCGRERMFDVAVATPSDINEHMPLLRKLAERCDHVTEFGMRWARGSTVAFLAAQPETLISWDLDPTYITAPRVASLLQLKGDTRFEPRTGDTLKISPIEPTDMLFIDTLHTGEQLLRELERHVDPKNASVRKYLAFHDTATFGLAGELPGTAGLRTAIRQFQKFFAFPLWKLMNLDGKLLDLDNNNGLIVLEHVCADGHSPDLLRGEICRWCGKKVG